MRLNRIYFDNAATTPVDPRVAETMMYFMVENFGNASSLHADGNRAREVLDISRKTIADSLGATPDEICFTSSGTESNEKTLLNK